MADWKTLKEVAEELGISKDLVKYHRKNLDIFQIERENGVYRVSPQGSKKFAHICERKIMMQRLKKK